MFINASEQDESFVSGERSIAMDNHRVLQKADDEQPLAMNGSRPGTELAENPNSWFRKRLDHVRNEARKDIQLKSIRPLDEK